MDAHVAFAAGPANSTARLFRYIDTGESEIYRLGHRNSRGTLSRSGGRLVRRARSRGATRKIAFGAAQLWLAAGDLRTEYRCTLRRTPPGTHGVEKTVWLRPSRAVSRVTGCRGENSALARRLSSRACTMIASRRLEDGEPCWSSPASEGGCATCRKRDGKMCMWTDQMIRLHRAASRRRRARSFKARAHTLSDWNALRSAPTCGHRRQGRVAYEPDYCRACGTLAAIERGGFDGFCSPPGSARHDDGVEGIEDAESETDHRLLRACGMRQARRRGGGACSRKETVRQVLPRHAVANSRVIAAERSSRRPRFRSQTEPATDRVDRGRPHHIAPRPSRSTRFPRAASRRGAREKRPPSAGRPSRSARCGRRRRAGSCRDSRSAPASAAPRTPPCRRSSRAAVSRCAGAPGK